MVWNKWESAGQSLTQLQEACRKRLQDGTDQPVNRQSSTSTSGVKKTLSERFAPRPALSLPRPPPQRSTGPQLGTSSLAAQLERFRESQTCVNSVHAGAEGCSATNRHLERPLGSPQAQPNLREQAQPCQNEDTTALSQPQPPPACLGAAGPGPAGLPNPPAQQSPKGLFGRPAWDRKLRGLQHFAPLQLSGATADVSTGVVERQAHTSLDPVSPDLPERECADASQADEHKHLPAARVSETRAGTDVLEEAMQPAGKKRKAGCKPAEHPEPQKHRVAAEERLLNAPSHGPDEPLIFSQCTEEGPALRLAVPASINRYLREYQREGIRFLFRQYARGVGGILGDDMGLGKTVQTIAFLAALLADGAREGSPVGRRRPMLIVAPTSVLTNWQRELDMWGPFRAVLYLGKLCAPALAAVTCGDADLLLTSYETFKMQEQELNRVQWHVALFDEAHKMKNFQSKTLKAAARLNTKLRYGLTGTAMPNDHLELYTLLDWATPGCCGDRAEFTSYYVGPIKKGQKRHATEHELDMARTRTGELRALVLQYFLRRTKDNTIRAQLPAKRDNIVLCSMSRLQARAYRRLLESPDFQLLVRYFEPCDCASGLKRGRCCHRHAEPGRGGVLWPHYHLCDPNWRDEWYKPDGCEKRPNCPLCLTFACLIVLRKVVTSLELLKVDPTTAGDDEVATRRALEVEALALGEDAEAAGGLLRAWEFGRRSDMRLSGKLACLDRLLALWNRDPSNKVLVFSQSCTMLDMVEGSVIRCGYNYLRLDGSTPQGERQPAVDRFNHSASLFLFLISTTAGGLGLNLTAANKVVICDVSWNPAHDLQAQDRVFRIGQRRDVDVYRLVATGTIEETIYMRQIYKQQQSAITTEGTAEARYFHGVQGEKHEKGELFGMVNLLKETFDRIVTHDVLTATLPDGSTMLGHYTIQPVEFARPAQEDLDAFCEDQEGAKPPKAAKSLNSELGEDPGLGILAQRIFKEADKEHSAYPRSPKAATEEDALQGGGALAMHRHEALLGGLLAGCAKALPASTPMAHAEAVLVSTAAPPRAASRTSRGEKAGVGRWRAVNALASWRGVSPVQMACQMLGMTAQQRKELRQAYATVQLA